MKVMIVVTHLLGVGHLARASALGRALARAGHRVTLVSGGAPAPNVPLDGIDVVQLPPLAARGADFKTLYAADGNVAGPETYAVRQQMLLMTARDLQPDAVIIELFPFGRRQLAAEFVALLDDLMACAQPPAILSSVRDVLAPPSTPKKAARTVALLERYFDRVLVHGDAAILPLEASWPVPPHLARRLSYTGYVRDGQAVPAVATDADGAGEIVVSGGGSDAALPLFRAALGAARLMPGRDWRILVGHGVSNSDFAKLQYDAPANVRVARVRRDFAAVLARAACSVSMAGYNTVLDLAAARVPAVVVPFDGGNEVEQSIRAEKFAGMGLLDVVRSDALAPATLLDAVERAMHRGAPAGGWIATDGAETAVALIEAEMAERDALRAAWARVTAGLDRLQAEGVTFDFWWRDDDAIAPSPALDRLLALARAVKAPLALAVIPDTVQSALAERLAAEPDVCVLVHGIAHRNHAAAGRKKQELVAADADTLAALASGSERLARMFGAQALPVLVPPWNRMSPDIVTQLAGLGFTGLSTFAGAQHDEAGLRVVDTHIDPIDWKHGGGAGCASTHIHLLANLVEARAGGRGKTFGPVGLLTHHLVHDGWIWRQVEDMLRRLAGHEAVRFVSAAASFGLTGATGQAPKDG